MAEKLIIIDSCMRAESRTRRILKAAEEVLSGRYEIEKIDVSKSEFPAVVEACV